MPGTIIGIASFKYDLGNTANAVACPHPPPPPPSPLGAQDSKAFSRYAYVAPACMDPTRCLPRHLSRPGSSMTFKVLWMQWRAPPPLPRGPSSPPPLDAWHNNQYCWVKYDLGNIVNAIACPYKLPPPPPLSSLTLAGAQDSKAICIRANALKSRMPVHAADYRSSWQQSSLEAEPRPLGIHVTPNSKRKHPAARMSWPACNSWWHPSDTNWNESFSSMLRKACTMACRMGQTSSHEGLHWSHVCDTLSAKRCIVAWFVPWTFAGGCSK